MAFGLDIVRSYHLQVLQVVLLNVIPESMGNTNYFLIWYYIEIITLEEGEIFLYSNEKWNVSVHNTTEYFYQHKKAQSTPETEKLTGHRLVKGRPGWSNAFSRT